MRTLSLIAHNLRSCHNVGSLLRTAEGLAIEQVYLTGYTPYPLQRNDPRLPHLAKKIDAQISKTALGAEKYLGLHRSNIVSTIDSLRENGYTIIAIEQAKGSIKLSDYDPPEKIALIIGREVEGIEPEVLNLCDAILEIPMLGKKESFNVAQAAAMALFHCRFAD